MKIFSIKNGGVLFEGPYSSIKKCLEAATRAGKSLPHADLRRARLSGARLDGISMPGACLWGADLSGADIGAAYLHRCDFRLAELRNTCLADSVCSSADFRGASFSGVILDEVDFSRAHFSCPTFLRQDLSLVKSLQGAVYHHKGEAACGLSLPPVIVRGLGPEIILLDSHIKVDGDIYPIEAGPADFHDLVLVLAAYRDIGGSARLKGLLKN